MIDSARALMVEKAFDVAQFFGEEGHQAPASKHHLPFARFPALADDGAGRRWPRRCRLHRAVVVRQAAG